MSKFSVDTFRASLLARREFLCALLAGNYYFPTQLMAVATNSLKKRNQTGHFFWLDLKSGEVHLPAEDGIITGQPGSLMKLVAATAILQENLPSATKVIDCRGATIVNGKHYICRYPHGRISLVEAIGQSCNVFFARTAKELNSECFLHYLKKFGLSQSIHLSRNKPPSNVDLILGLAEQYNFNAIQILQLVTLIATSGHFPSLYYNIGQMDMQQDKLAKQKESARQSTMNQKCFINDPGLSERTWNILQTGMHIACQRGTAKNLDPQNKLHLAVKTGTTTHGGSFQSWLAGYFPFESPRYSFCLRSNVGTSYDRAVPSAQKYLFAKDWT